MRHERFKGLLASDDLETIEKEGDRQLMRALNESRR
jgi:hypothetical protein